MSLSVFTTSCMVLSLVFWCLNSAKASSIYVGKHEAGEIPESQTSESVHVIPEDSCKDSSSRLCLRILKVYGENVCMTNDRVLLLSLKNICQRSCGFCDTDCEDQFEDLCVEYAGSCNTDGDLGNLMKEICPRTCRSCQLRPHKQSELVVIHGNE